MLELGGAHREDGAVKGGDGREREEERKRLDASEAKHTHSHTKVQSPTVE